MEQLDIKTAFLNGLLKANDVCYMEQPEGFVKAGMEHMDQLHSEWQLSDFGDALFCIGIAIKHDWTSHTVSLSQSALIDHLIRELSLQDAHPVASPTETNLRLSRVPKGSLVADVTARMDRTPYRQLLSRHLDSYGPAHWEAAKRVLWYLKGMRDLKLMSGSPHAACLLGFTNASFATCPDML
ncbi:hypothetical protein PAXRUDRAFT_21869 [Paxillus rubicundulus Ve08.2h10]|uniref:Reverse transcriptase Ty1/copia-type domain-containing protein n=1 Tax=Paxillus rubicundulus Ve08.2h10 TaxID=930991 RepID=A0A0D0D6M0_9AGAM|nr:hypothetical protein PAXRUDRAFT_21869 [Paxillus rubicundulus Ve08.2h10]